jgi:hypothetical protein
MERTRSETLKLFVVSDPARVDLVTPFIEGVIPRPDGRRFYRLPLSSCSLLDEFLSLVAEGHSQVYCLNRLEMLFRVSRASLFGEEKAKLINFLSYGRALMPRHN